MHRRRVLEAAATAAAGVTGCLGGGGGDEDTPTEDSPLPNQDDAGTLEYLVRNDDDRGHSLEVLVENPQGTIVHRKADAEFEPGEQLGGTFEVSGEAEGEYPVTVALESLAVTIGWKPNECVRFDTLVSVTSDGQLAVEREECIK